MTFEEVAVTEGDTNDYYVEITGDDLHEGDIIRATADLTQGIESSTDSAAQMMEDGSLYVGDGSDMPEGVTIAPAAGNDMARPRRRSRRARRSVMQNTEQFAHTIAQSLLGAEADHPARPLIAMRGIRKSYYIGQPNELEILHGIDLTVYPGEFVAIVGESGSGKSHPDEHYRRAGQADRR